MIILFQMERVRHFIRLMTKSVINASLYCIPCQDNYTIKYVTFQGIKTLAYIGHLPNNRIE